jgi:hypothetical protein
MKKLIAVLVLAVSTVAFANAPVAPSKSDTAAQKNSSTKVSANGASAKSAPHKATVAKVSPKATSKKVSDSKGAVKDAAK